MKYVTRLASYLLASTMMMSICTNTYANNTTNGKSADATIVEKIGMLIGEGEGVTVEYLGKKPTRIQAAVMFIRLKGLEKEALNFKGNQNFNDAENAPWAKPIMAYLKSNPHLGWVGDGVNFNPNDLLTPQMYYKVMLESIGYKANADFKWDDVISFANSRGIYKVANVKNFTVSDLATATVEALKTNVKDGNKTLIERLAENDSNLKTKAQEVGLIASSSQLALDSVTIKNASSLVVKFTSPVSDTSKAVINITRDSAKVDGLSLSWNNEKTEATFKSNNKLTNGTYIASVLYDNNNLGSKSAAIEADKIKDIVFAADSVVLTDDTTGEVFYKVLNQYGEDITDSHEARKIKWDTSADNISADTQSGVLTIIENGKKKLKDIDNINITAYDENSGYTKSKNLNITNGEDILKNIKFKGIVDENGEKKDIYMDSTERFFIDYEATDSSGNKLDSYALLSNDHVFKIFTSDKDIEATIVRDSANMSKAKIEVTTHSDEGTADITGVVLSSGKTDKISVTVKKGATLSEFKMSEPSEEPKVGKRIEIPFKAKDQDGNKMTKYEDIFGKVDFTINDKNNATITQEKAADGSYKLSVWFNAEKKYTLFASVDDSSKTSSITMDVEAAAVPTSLYEVSKNVVYPYIVQNGQISIDCASKAFKVYSRDNEEMSLADNNIINSKHYYIRATSSDSSKVNILGSNQVAYKNTPIIIAGGANKGSANILFELCEDTDNNPDNGKTVLSTRSVTITNIDRDQITSYEFKPIETLYANPAVATDETYEKASDQEKEYAGDIVINGKTSGGNVAINQAIGAGNDIVYLAATDTEKFYVSQQFKKILAKTIGSDSEATTKLVATIMKNGQPITITTDVKSSKAIPNIQSIDISLKQGSGLTRSDDSFTGTQAEVAAALFGKELRRFDKKGDASDRADITFDIKDQYGKYGTLPVYFTLSKVSGNGNLAIDGSTGLVTGNANSGDQYTITAVAVNGNMKTATLVVR